MVQFNIDGNAFVLSELGNLCTVKGSHITFAAIDGDLYAAAVSPEYFKIIKLDSSEVPPNFAIRIQKTMIKPLLSTPCVMKFTITDNVTISRYSAKGLLATVRVPLEYDFNSELISNAVNAGSNTTGEYDITPLAEIKSIIPFGTSGLQLKDNLAYIHGNGFIVYRKLQHPINFIMSAANMTELLKFVRANGRVQIYESDVYVVFRNADSYFGCRQPLQFVESNYGDYLSSERQHAVSADLTELHNILGSFTIPKGDNPMCRLLLDRHIAVFDIGADYHFEVSLGNAGTECEEISVSVSVLKNIFSNSNLDYTDASILVYPYFVVFRLGAVDLLVSRYD